MKKLLLSYLFLGLLFTACNKDNDDDDTPPNPITGQIDGEIRLADEFGKELAVHSGVLVKTTSFYDLTDGGGNYQVHNLVPGYYDLIFEKQGYGTYKKFNIGVIENSTTTISGIDSIGQKSTTVVNGLTATWQPADSTYDFGCTLSPSPTVIFPRSFRLFFGKSSTVSFQDYFYTPSQAWTATTASGVLTGFERQELIDYGFNPGETVYVIAYGESIITNTYTNPVTSKKVFPNMNAAFPSNSVSFILP